MGIVKCAGCPEAFELNTVPSRLIGNGAGYVPKCPKCGGYEPEPWPPSDLFGTDYAFVCSPEPGDCECGGGDDECCCIPQDRSQRETSSWEEGERTTEPDDLEPSAGARLAASLFDDCDDRHTRATSPGER